MSRSSNSNTQTKPKPKPAFAPKRDSESRIAELQRQKELLDAQHEAAPERPDFSLTNLRELRNELFMQGYKSVELNAAMNAAKDQNAERKAALRAIRKSIAEKYDDPHRRKQELAKYMDKLNVQYDKDYKAWENKQGRIDQRMAALDAAINTERIIEQENERYADVRQHNEEIKQAERQRIQEVRELREQIAQDLAAARLKAIEERNAERANVEPVQAYRQELNRRKTYWQAASRGDWDAAKQIYPSADHDQNRRDLEELTPPSSSKANTKAYENAMKELQYEVP